MKIKLNPSAQKQGSALLVTVIIGAIIGFTLASYLVLVSSQNQSVMRSLAWNSAIPVLEAGVEEALTHLKYNEVSQLGRNGWQATSQSGMTYYVKRVQIGDSFCVVAIEPINPTPVIYSTAYVPAPLSPTQQASAIQAQIGPSLDETAFLGKGYLKRKVRVRTARDYLFTKAMVAEEDISLKGFNITTDSFISSASPDGKYHPANARDNGDVATNSGLIDAFEIGNAKIKGKISTGPDGMVDIGPNGSVGTKQWVEGSTRGIETGRSSDDMNVEFPPVTYDYVGNANPGSFTDQTDNTFYKYSLAGGGSYQIAKLTDGNVYVTASEKPTILYVSEAFQMNNYVIKLQEGATLHVYVASESASLAGKTVVNPGVAANFMYFGLPTNTELKLAGNGAFTGVIYAPSAAFELKGGGNDTVTDFTGASVTRTVKMAGHFNFHYDEDLAVKGPFKGYIPISWDEI